MPALSSAVRLLIGPKRVIENEITDRHLPKSVIGFQRIGDRHGAKYALGPSLPTSRAHLSPIRHNSTLLAPVDLVTGLPAQDPTSATFSLRFRPLSLNLEDGAPTPVTRRVCGIRGGAEASDAKRCYPGSAVCRS